MKEISDKLCSNWCSHRIRRPSSDVVGEPTLVTALEARVDDVELKFVQQALIHEEQKLNGNFGDTSLAASAGQSDAALLGE